MWTDPKEEGLPEPFCRVGQASWSLPWDGELLCSRFGQRRNRFLAEVTLSPDKTALVYLPNSGRMRELCLSGTPALVLLHPKSLGSRKTVGRLVALWSEGQWVGTDAHRANQLWETLLHLLSGAPAGSWKWKKEVLWEGQRLDFLCETPKGLWLVEIKNCNRAEGKVGLFPDAPTLRGSRQLEALSRWSLRKRGQGAVIWIIQRSDVECLRFDHQADPLFVKRARAAQEAGVMLLAWKCRVDQSGLHVTQRVPVRA
jgi:sugar fermentation stimulation protein A